MDMDCHSVRENINAYIDRELSEMESRLVAAHIEDCLSCRHEFDAYSAVRDFVRQNRDVASPPDLSENIRIIMEKERLLPRRKLGIPALRLRPWQMAVAACFLVAILSASALKMFLPRPRYKAETFQVVSVPVPLAAKMKFRESAPSAAQAGPAPAEKNDDAETLALRSRPPAPAKDLFGAGAAFSSPATGGPSRRTQSLAAVAAGNGSSAKKTASATTNGRRSADKGSGDLKKFMKNKSGDGTLSFSLSNSLADTMPIQGALPSGGLPVLPNTDFDFTDMQNMIATGNISNSTRNPVAVAYNRPGDGSNDGYAVALTETSPAETPEKIVVAKAYKTNADELSYAAAADTASGKNYLDFASTAAPADFGKAPAAAVPPQAHAAVQNNTRQQGKPPLNMTVRVQCKVPVKCRAAVFQTIQNAGGNAQQLKNGNIVMSLPPDQTLMQLNNIKATSPGDAKINKVPEPLLQNEANDQAPRTINTEIIVEDEKDKK